MTSSDRWLVTGAGGTLGSAIVARLAADGTRLRVLEHHTSLTHLRGVAEVVSGSLGEAESLGRALDGVSGVVHAAALLEGEAEDLFAVQADGTQTLARAAARAGVARFVLVSTAAVLAPGAFVDADEDHELGPSEPYGASKLEGERRAHAELGERLVTLRPPSLFGPGRTRFVGQLAAAVLHHQLPLRADDGACIECVHGDDVADAIAALVAGRGASSLYHLAGPSRPRFGELLREVGALLATSPRFVAWPAAPDTQAPSFDAALLEFATVERSLSCARAQRELGYAPTRDWRTTLRSLAGPR